MLRNPSVRLTLVLVSTLHCLILPKAGAQTPWPNLCIQDVEWTDDTHHVAVTQPIEAPCSPAAPVEITSTADAEFVSGTEVHLKDGFHAGDFTGDGQFHAYINDALGNPADLVLISPDPATHIVNNVVHVEKWEKLEVGLRLPQEYRDAIERFFGHYYSLGADTMATPDSVDVEHDLNPFADDSLLLVMKLTSPSGEPRMKWGFYMKEGTWASMTDTARLAVDVLDTLHPYSIRFRFAPDEVGIWQFALDLRAPHTSTLAEQALPSLAFTGYAFVCDPPLEDNHGPLHVNEVNRRVLQFEDGTPFFGLGTNMSDAVHGHWANGIGDSWISFFRRDQEVMLRTMEQLHSVGGNFMRIMLMRHLFAPEWVNLGVYDAYQVPPVCDEVDSQDTTCPHNGWTTRFKGNCQSQLWAFDQLLDSARKNNIYIQLCIDPNAPAIASEKLSWGAHPYVIHFLDPERQPAPWHYNMNAFFYKDGDTTITEEGVFYYWKRKYKYLMARWGYSVNLPIIEPFNEVDQTPTYPLETDTMVPGLVAPTCDIDDIANNDMCRENRVVWAHDEQLPHTVSKWHTDMARYVRGEVDPDDPVSSPLGENKLFLASFTDREPAINPDPDYFLTFSNPEVDLIDVHKGIQHEWDIRASFDSSRSFRDEYPNALSGLKKPFHHGEFTTYAHDVDSGYYDTWRYLDNYDVSFHNELWASAFFGNFATGTSWAWARPFWWPDALQAPEPDPLNVWQPLGQFFNELDSTNYLDLGGFGVYPIVNKPVYHNFKPLSDMLANPEWQAMEFFNQGFRAHNVYDTAGRVECYYLVNDAGSQAIGWLHNLNAFWENHYYVKKARHNFLGCLPPDTQAVTLEGFAQDHDYYVAWFPTRLNGTTPPDTVVTSTLSGTLILDVSSEPMNGIVNNYLDTLHSDYAFIIAPFPVYRGMLAIDERDTAVYSDRWDFSLFPNPAVETLNVLLPDDGAIREIAIYDMTGRRVYNLSVSGLRTVTIPTTIYAKGPYGVQVSDATYSKTRTFILR